MTILDVPCGLHKLVMCIAKKLVGLAATLPGHDPSPLSHCDPRPEPVDTADVDATFGPNHSMEDFFTVHCCMIADTITEFHHPAVPSVNDVKRLGEGAHERWPRGNVMAGGMQACVCDLHC